MNTQETTYSRAMKDPELNKLILEEKFILDITEKLCEIMEQKKLSRAALARKMGVSRALITQFLDGARNMRLRTLYKLVDALDCIIDLNILDSTECSFSMAVPKQNAKQFRSESRFGNFKLYVITDNEKVAA